MIGLDKMKAGEQHRWELDQNRKSWGQKKLLRGVYNGFYTKIKSQLPGGPSESKILELGSGVGAIKDIIPSCMTSELFYAPGIDRVENAYDLNLDQEELDALILFDVFHHLQFIGEVFAEFKRVLRPGGRVLLFEPDMSLLGRFVYGLCHAEPLSLNDSICWDAPLDFNTKKVSYYAAQGNAWRLFIKGELKEKWSKDWRLISNQRIVSFSYWGSGGFSRRQFYPDSFLGFMNKMDTLLQSFPSFFSARLLVTLEKK
jgi:SAM-dependent methyltransferase